MELIPTAPANLPAEYNEAAARYARASRAPNTERAYRGAWAQWTSWADQNGADALPAAPSAVAAHLAGLADAGARLSTIEMRRAAISAAHKLAQAADPCAAEAVRLTMRGIRRALGSRPAKKAPVTLADLAQLVEALPDTLAGKRDKALILLGWAGAFRRSELVGLEVADLRINGELKATVRRSKTDQAGAGLVKVVPALSDPALCPVRAMREYLAAAGIASGPVFRPVDRWGNLRPGRMTAQSVALVIKHAAAAAGLDAAQFAGHSLRSGFITAAHLAGASERDIAEVSGHKSAEVLRGYIQDAGLGARRAIARAFGE